MPKFAFECSACQVQFERNLKPGANPEHPCPSCHQPAARLWMGQGFAFDFATPTSSAPANTGVAKKDYPSADQAVGSSAEARWGEYTARAEVKDKVREVGGNRALLRRNGQDFVEYQAGDKNLIDARKKLVKEAEQGAWGVPGAKPSAKPAGQ